MIRTQKVRRKYEVYEEEPPHSISAFIAKESQIFRNKKPRLADIAEGQKMLSRGD